MSMKNWKGYYSGFRVYEITVQRKADSWVQESTRWELAEFKLNTLLWEVAQQNLIFPLLSEWLNECDGA